MRRPIPNEKSLLRKTACESLVPSGFPRGFVIF